VSRATVTIPVVGSDSVVPNTASRGNGGRVKRPRGQHLVVARDSPKCFL
jgi:hypothetical protein